MVSFLGPADCACRPLLPQRPPPPSNIKARRYLAEWVASPAPFSAYDGMKRFTFDVLVNQAG